MSRMRAVQVKEANGPFELVEREIPSPDPREVLIKVHATTVSSGDWRVRSLSMPPGFGLLSRLFGRG